MRKENLITVIIFLTMIFAGGAAFWLIPDKTFSEEENRYLEECPKISGEKIMSGEFMEDFDTYVSDQFPLRNVLMEGASDYKYIIGMRDINGAYVGKDGYIMTKTDKFSVDYEQIERNIRHLNDFFAKYKDGLGGDNICFMLVPEAAMVLEDKLPDYADCEWENELLYNIRAEIENAEILAAEKYFDESNRQLYYKTDHHWSGYGAFEAYRVYAEHYGRDARFSDYEWKIVTDSFKGSLYSKVLLSGTASDEIVLDAGMNEIKITADGEEMLLYEYEALEQKDKYEVFLGGNYGLVEIEGKGEGTLLILKDSFANSFVPFLVNDYEKIVMIDLRYYMGDIDIIMESKNISQILVLYQITNFISDENMIKLGL